MGSTFKAIQRIREQLAELRTQREEVVQASTEKKLERLREQESSLLESLASLERVQSNATSNAAPSEEETRLWNQIRENMDQEQGIINRVGSLPVKYIRADALEYFGGQLRARREEIDAQLEGIESYQRMGSRLREEVDALEADERAFPAKHKPFCIAGEKVHALRTERSELSAKRDALKAERESKILATA